MKLWLDSVLITQGETPQKWIFPNELPLLFGAAQNEGKVLDSLAWHGLLDDIEIYRYKIERTRVSVFPNPVYDVLNILMENIEKSDFLIEIYDIYGRKVVNKKMAGLLNELDIEFLAAGTYVVKLTQGKSTTFLTKKFLKY